MSFEPTPTQALLLFGLLGRHGECKQAELMPAILAKDREALAGAQLIKAGKAGRSFVLNLEDAGWAWAASHLSAELPPPQQALSDLLKRLGDHLASSGETLADFVGSKPKEAPSSRIPAASKPAAKMPKASKHESTKTVPEKTAKPKAVVKALKAPTPAALRKRIEAAFLTITGGRKDEGVSLARLRGELSDLDRPTIDGALGRILKNDTKAALMRHDDPRRIGKADEDAAYSPAGEPFHVLWIAS